MFDFAWSEFALIGVLALVLIGPKDLPVAIKAASQMLKKARRMAGEFQTHVDDLVREANLQEVRDGLSELKRMDIKGQILKAVDDDGSIRSSLTNPISDFSLTPPPVPVHDTVPAGGVALDTITGESLATATLGDEALAAGLSGTAFAPGPPPPPPPAFVPPTYMPKPPRPIPPAFVPPHAAKLAEHA